MSVNKVCNHFKTVIFNVISVVLFGENADCIVYIIWIPYKHKSMDPLQTQIYGSLTNTNLWIAYKHKSIDHLQTQIYRSLTNTNLWISYKHKSMDRLQTQIYQSLTNTNLWKRS